MKAKTKSKLFDAMALVLLVYAFYYALKGEYSHATFDVAIVILYKVVHKK